MNLRLLLALSFLCNWLYAQPWRYRVEVQSSAKMIYLDYEIGGVQYRDSAHVRGKLGVLSGELSQPVAATLTAEQALPLSVFLHNVQLELELGEQGRLITADPINADYAQLTHIDRVRRSYFPLYGRLNAEGDTAGLRRLALTFDSLKQVDIARARDYATANPTSPLVLFAFSRYSTFLADYARLEPEFDALPTWVRQSPEGRLIAAKIAGAKSVELGKPAPLFEQANASGKVIQLSSFRGKLVLVDFWASWCAPCRKKHPALRALYNEYRQRGFEILSVSLDSDRADWVAAAQKDGISWADVSDLRGMSNAVAVQYGIQAIPASILVDANGVVIGRDLELAELRQLIERTLPSR